jgi:hypothetical protein
VLDLGEHAQRLSRLEIGADAQREVRVALEPVVASGHGR